MTTTKMPDADKRRLKLRVQQGRKPKGYARPSIQKALDSGDIQGVIDKLTLLQRRFAEEYIMDYNGAEAYVRAGGTSKYPNRAAYQFLQNPGIRACIDQLTLQRADESIVKPEFVINKIVKTINKAEQDNNHNATLRGCELLARTMGMFIDRQEISGPNGDAIQIQQQIREAADAFTSAVASYVEREREGNVLEFPVGRGKG